nr:LOW QUALITY PROTEIN: uncharacterized protein LOC105340464 [Crassostrea gigas]
MATTRKRGRPATLTDSARKRRKMQVDRDRSRERIFIGDHFERWNRVKADLNLRFNHEVAGFLLDRYEADLHQKTVASSTPVPKTTNLGRLQPGISDISSVGSGKQTDSAMSGVEEMESDPGPSTKLHVEPDPAPSTSQRVKVKFGSSFLDPSELSIYITEESGDEDDDATEYEPSFNLSLGPREVIGIEDCPGMESVLPDDDDDDGIDDEVETETGLGGGPSITQVMCAEDIPNQLTANATALVFLKQLIVLANLKVTRACQVKGCGEDTNIEIQHVGSALYLKWICSNSHLAEKWCSQPILNRGLHAGDLMLSAAILFSGNNFGKMELFAKFLKLGFPGQSTFTRLQKRYLVPAVDEYWTSQQTGIVDEMSDKDLIILGDGRMDSPGHCAQYCTYTVMEDQTKKILSLKTLDKRETEKKSTNLEKAGFVKCLQEIQEKGLTVKEVVTDAHLQIGAMMKKDYPEIKHSHDIWHAAKNLGKKLLSAGQEKNCKELQKWSKDVVNHFWYVCKADNMDEFLGMWAGVLHHVVDEHEWFLPYSDGGISACAHDPLSDPTGDKVWITKGSPAHEALRKIVLDKRFLNNIHYYLNFRSTAELESFHNHLLMYSSKRYAYSPPVYRARNLLAALDYNENVDRQPIRNKDGTLRLQRTYNKKSGRWTVYPVKEKKKYEYIQTMMEWVLDKRLEDKEGFHKQQDLDEGDPRRLSKTIAPVLPPPTSELAAEKKSRFEA